MMLAAGEAAFVRKFNRWVGSLGEYFLSVVLRARRVRYTDDLFAIQAKVAKPILEVASSVNGVLTTDVNNLRFLIRVYAGYVGQDEYIEQGKVVLPIPDYVY